MSDDRTVSDDTVCFTPPPESAFCWDGKRYSIPWQGNTYQIYEKASGNCIGVNSEGNISLVSEQHENIEYTHWHCVEKNGYVGFQNQKTGKYLGHDGKQALIASAKRLQSWECFVTRQHPKGGYQLLSPYYEHTLLQLCVSENGQSLERRHHGTTVWNFIEA